MQKRLLFARPLKFLIVDDHAPFRGLLAKLVGGPGIEIQECAEGGEAIVRYEVLQPDWVLMDIHMQPLDGLAATRRIKARFPEAKIVVLTLNTDVYSRSAAMQAGASAFLGKDDLGGLRELLGAAVPPNPSEPEPQ